jgi:DNA topoisomerase-1
MDTHGEKSARKAGLKYAGPDAPGISRQRRGSGFTYRSATGRAVRDTRTLDRIRALAIPPAWTDVWIAVDPRAHIQVTGRDAAGRKQYRYHPLWTAERDSTKYHRMLAFADALPAIRKRIANDLRKPPASRPFVLATVVALLERTHFRVGNEEYVRANGSHGLTTLRDRHVKIKGRHLHFAFRAKSGIQQSVDLDDARLAKAVRVCQDLPGQVLFQYEDDDAKVRAVSSSDVNDYLRDASGGEFTAKDFRTWAGTLAAAKELDTFEPPASLTAGKRSIVEAVDRVAESLGNTRAVCRKCYIHPAVLEAYQAGLTIGRITARKRVTPALREAEARLVRLLEQMTPARQKKAA